MSQNPEEGRLTAEQQAELLTQSRKRTVEMRRELRSMQRSKAAEEKANRWAANHKQQHEDAYEDIERASSGGRPLNRRNRRTMAKKMNVFKTPEGWQHFNNHYGQKFGKREPFVKKPGTMNVIKSNIMQALENARVTPEKVEQ